MCWFHTLFNITDLTVFKELTEYNRSLVFFCLPWFTQFLVIPRYFKHCIGKTIDCKLEFVTKNKISNDYKCISKYKLFSSD